MQLVVEDVVRDEGTVVVLRGRDVDTGDVVVFAADHRPAMFILEALLNTDDAVYAEVDEWQVLQRVKAVGQV